MKKTLPILLAVATLWLSAAAHAESAQQMKMKECTAQAKGKTGAERKAFMKECLGGSAAASSSTPSKAAEAPATEKKLTAQQLKMRECNSQAKGMKGEERKKFMKECLSKKK